VPLLKRKTLFFIFTLLLAASIGKAGMVVNAGSAKTVCAGDSVTLGGNPTASGGTAPYTYTWTPVAGMNNPADSNPRVKVIATTWYYVAVTDFTGNRVTDSVKITVDPINQVTAGNSASICPFGLDTAFLGASTNPPASGAIHYTWTPPAGLSCSTCSQPYALPSATTTYTMVANDGACSDTSYVTVTVLPPPTLTVISPVIIKEGQTAILSVSGGVSYTWSPTGTLYNQNSANPEAYPSSTTTYIVVGTGANGCINFDSVLVEVIPDSNLVFYNTITPNHDGINDTWFIGNLNLYPNNDVYIYNRYGKQVYYAHGYLNQWDASNLGDEMPDATYYYVVYTGTGKSYNGSITVIRKP